MNSNNFKSKYEKYKNKYLLQKKKQFGGECDPMPDRDDLDLFENLSVLQPNERITIRGKCYNVRSLYEWIITDNNNELPPRPEFITDVERQKLINAYRILLTPPQPSNILTPSQPSNILTPLQPSNILTPLQPSNILTREKLIELYPNLMNEIILNLSNRGFISIAIGTFSNLPRLKY